MVEVRGVEPLSETILPPDLHAYPNHLNFASDTANGRAYRKLVAKIFESIVVTPTLLSLCI